MNNVSGLVLSLIGDMTNDKTYDAARKTAKYDNAAFRDAIRMI